MQIKTVSILVALLLLSALPLNVAADENDDIPTNAMSTGVHDSLVAALAHADLVTTLQGDGPFTVFAPTDDAFTAAGIDLSTFDTDEENATLVDILLYHVYSGAVNAADVTDGLTVTMVNGDEASFTVTNGTVMVGDATVTTADVASSNGIIHVIDKVLMPPADPTPQGEICYNTVTHTIVPGSDATECESYMYLEDYEMNGQNVTGCYNSVTHQVSNVSQAICEGYMWAPAVDIAMTAMATGIHSSLVAALTKADLVTTLQGDGPFTVFAPTDQAFTDAGIDLDSFTTDEDIATLTDVLLYHVYSGAVNAADVTDGLTVTMVNGDEASFTVTAEAVMVGDATVVLADVPASNGVIHVIDKVLMPPADPTPQGEICYNTVTHTIVPGSDATECESYMYLEDYEMNGQNVTGCYNSVTHQVSNVSQAICEGYMWAPAVDIAMTAMATGIHSSLVAALTKADLVTTLQGDGPFTVFAPTDQAFTDAGIDLDSFTTDEDIATLTDILLYHVYSGAVNAADVTDGLTVTMVNGDEASFTVTAEAVMVGDATVVLADVPASNGVIHVIDKVLMPPVDVEVPDNSSDVVCDVTIGLSPTGYAFSPSVVAIEVDQTVCWSWSNAEMEHNIKEVDEDKSSKFVENGITSGIPETTVEFHYTFTENTTFYYACEPHISLDMFGKVIVGDGGIEPVDDSSVRDGNSTPGFLGATMLLATLGAILYSRINRSEEL